MSSARSGPAPFIASYLHLNARIGRAGPEPPASRRAAASGSEAHCPAPPPGSAGSWWGVVGGRGPQPRLLATPAAWGTGGGGDPESCGQGCACCPPYLSKAPRSAVRGGSIHSITLILARARCLLRGALVSRADMLDSVRQSHSQGRGLWTWKGLWVRLGIAKEPRGGGGPWGSLGGSGPMAPWSFLSICGSRHRTRPSTRPSTLAGILVGRGPPARRPAGAAPPPGAPSQVTLPPPAPSTLEPLPHHQLPILF